MKKIILPVIVFLFILSVMYCESAGDVLGKDPEVIACEQAVEEAYKQCKEEAGDDDVALTACEVARQKGIDECNK